MKKLIALFAILVAFTATTFAAESAPCTVTVNAFTEIEVTVTGSANPENILVGGTSTVTFIGTNVRDEDWEDFGDDLITSWSWSGTGGTWTRPTGWQGGQGGTLIVVLTNAVDGPNTVTAIYTVNYDF